MFKQYSKNTNRRKESDIEIVTKFEDVVTGETREVKHDDKKGFDECLSNPNMHLVFR